MKKTMLLASVMLILLFGVGEAYASSYYINGTVTRSDTGAGLSGVIVTANVTNTTTTDVTGFYSLTNNNNGTATMSFTVPNDGYVISSAPSTVVISGANNTSANAVVGVVTPTVSVVASASSRTIRSATVSWSSSIGTVGNRLLYSADSGLTNNLMTTGWSNSTSTPSFALAGLNMFTTYYYQTQTYNSNNGSYYVTSTGNFKTLAGTDEDVQTYQVVVQPQTTKSPLTITAPSAATVQGMSNIQKGVVILLVVGVFYLIFGKKK